MSVAMLSSKDRAGEAIRRFQQKVKAETGHKLGMLRTDSGGEFNLASFTEYCLENDVQRQLTAPYTPQQNGVVEHKNGTVVGTARSLLKVALGGGELY
jgi:transposase InsO family protein